jgi:hypothetical protein
MLNPSQILFMQGQGERFSIIDGPIIATAEPDSPKDFAEIDDDVRLGLS